MSHESKDEYVETSTAVSRLQFARRVHETVKRDDQNEDIGDNAIMRIFVLGSILAVDTESSHILTPVPGVLVEKCVELADRCTLAQTTFVPTDIGNQALYNDMNFLVHLFRDQSTVIFRGPDGDWPFYVREFGSLGVKLPGPYSMKESPDTQKQVYEAIHRAVDVNERHLFRNEEKLLPDISRSGFKADDKDTVLFLYTQSGWRVYLKGKKRKYVGSDMKEHDLSVSRLYVRFLRFLQFEERSYKLINF